ncbi:MAG: hypothetical protein L3K19_06735 [Thermoplasmata archaeon]|nr:hypothetical protein [Thermoplasmata archaeon]
MTEASPGLVSDEAGQLRAPIRPAAVVSAPPPARLARLRGWAGRHRPELLLVALSITFPELLTGSTPTLVLFDPISLAFLLGLYGAGVLLIRETSVRRGGGWPMILLLGGAYAFAEEAIGTKTYFDAALIGPGGAYGHSFGVNWLWVSQLTIFHAVFSIALPILVVQSVYPRTPGLRFFTDRGYRYLAVVFGLTVLAMFALFGWGWHLGWPYILGSLAAIALFTALAVRAGPSFPPLPRVPGSGTVPEAAAVGALFVWSFFTINWIGPSLRLPLPALIVGMVAVSVATLVYAVPRLSGPGRADRRLAFTAGAISFLVVLSFVTMIGGNFLVGGVDALLVLSFVRWARGLDPSPVPSIPPGASAAPAGG